MHDDTIRALIAAFLAFLIIAPAIMAQEGEVVQLKEILIKVEAELPTVMVTISRQEPEIGSSALTRPLENLLSESTTGVKPMHNEFEMNKVEEPQKILAKVREP